MIVAEEAEEEVDESEPVVKITLLEVAVLCEEVVFVNTALEVLVNWN